MLTFVSAFQLINWEVEKNMLIPRTPFVFGKNRQGGAAIGLMVLIKALRILFIPFFFNKNNENENRNFY